MTRWERWTNERVLEKAGMEVDMIEEVERSTLRWFGHLERMGGKKMTKEWKDKVEEGLRRIGVSLGEGIERGMFGGPFIKATPYGKGVGQ